MVPATLAQFLSFWKTPEGCVGLGPCPQELTAALEQARGVTLVLQGTEPLLGLRVQLLQVRWPPTGEENVVLVLVSYRSWPLAGPCVLMFVTLSLSGA